MKKLVITSTLLLPSLAYAAHIQAIKVGGEGSAEVSLIADGALSSTPRMTVEDNRVELTFGDVTLAPALAKQGDIASPHALIQKITPTATESGARIKLVVNGSTEKLRDRVRLQKKDGAIALVLTYPTGGEATLKLLQEEQVTLEPKKAEVVEARGGFGWLRLMLVLGLFGLAGAGTWYVFKFAKKKTGWGGSRRHLIETVAQAPVGDGKASVAILRVGAEFVMVGVTSSQVNFLSNLPKLQAQYEDETALERDSFKEAVAEAARQGAQRGLHA